MHYKVSNSLRYYANKISYKRKNIVLYDSTQSMQNNQKQKIKRTRKS